MRATAPSTLLDADYWAANLRNPVRFHQAITTAGAEHHTFIEISPHPLLTHAITDTLGEPTPHTIGTLQRDTDDTITFHTQLRRPRRRKTPPEHRQRPTGRHPGNTLAAHAILGR